eukprot:Polyplicarium_translucidae@DN3026_c0_g1_i2.p1
MWGIWRQQAQQNVLDALLVRDLFNPSWAVLLNPWSPDHFDKFGNTHKHGTMALFGGESGGWIWWTEGDRHFCYSRQQCACYVYDEGAAQLQPVPLPDSAAAFVERRDRGPTCHSSLTLKSYAARSMQGRRPKQEDRKFVIEDLSHWIQKAQCEDLDARIFDAASCSLFGLFDGHCGSLAAQYAEESFPLLFVRKLSRLSPQSEDGRQCALELQEAAADSDHRPRKRPRCETDDATEPPARDPTTGAPTDGNAETSTEKLEDNIKRALADTFEDLDQAFMKRYRTSHDGCAAAVVFVMNNATVFVAGLGDSRVILGERSAGKKFVCRQLSVDHKPSVVEERQRIEGSGGIVLDVQGVQRVALPDFKERCKRIKMGQATGAGSSQRPPVALAVSRAIGDRDFKFPEKILTATPDVIAHTLKKGEESFVLIGCDGIWDVMSNEDVVAVMEDHVPQGCEMAAKKLLLAAYEKGSLDNLTVVAAAYAGQPEETTSPDSDRMRMADT